MGRITSAVLGLLASLAGSVVRLVCFVFIVLLVLSNVPRLLAAGTTIARLQVAAGVALFASLAILAASWAGGLGE